jgi:hypothetical protein
MDTGHWILEEGVVIDDNTFGFIYEIVNKITNKKYIGKKQCFMRVKKKPLKGKKRNRITKCDSSWREYTSSSNDVNTDIQKYGKENFEFKILRICDSKWALAYYEIKEQIDKSVLFKDEYYNGIINCRIGKAPKAELEKFKDKGVII